MIEFNFNWTPVIVGLVAFFVGYLFAMLDRRVTHSIRDNKKELDENKAENSPPESADLSILISGEQPKVKLYGTPISPEQVTPEQRRQLIDLVNVLRPFIVGKPVATNQAAPQPQPRPAQPTSQSAPVNAPRPSPPPPAVPPQSPQPAPAPEAEGKKSDAKEKAPSMVAQIDAILQRRLAGTPLDNRGIRLVESPTGGVTVYVGLEHYESIDEISDLSVQTAIRAAINEWERTATPGS